MYSTVPMMPPVTVSLVPAKSWATPKSMSLTTPSAVNDPSFRDHPSVLRNQIQAVLCAPIGNPAFGVVYLQGAGDGFLPHNRSAVDIFARQLATAPAEAKNRALLESARSLRRRKNEILSENARDMAAAEKQGLTKAMLDRLLLTNQRLDATAKGLEEIAALPDPIGTVMAEWDRPNGLHIQRVRVPLGVIGVIYESRPNVTADAGALCLKAGNAAILRGGSESFHSSRAIVESLVEGLKAAGLPDEKVEAILSGLPTSFTDKLLGNPPASTASACSTSARRRFRPRRLCRRRPCRSYRIHCRQQ